MKKAIFLTAFIISLLTSVSLKADLELGEATPCTPDSLENLEWGDPIFTEFYPDLCPGCKFGIEFYTITYGGKKMIQITSIYLLAVEPPSTNSSCINCQNNNNQVFIDAYRDLIRYYAYDNYAMFEAQITPVSCKRFDNYLLSPTFLIIPTSNYISINSQITPTPNGPATYREPVLGRWIICETICCCIDVFIQHGLDQAPYVLEINSFLDCYGFSQPECNSECQGDCYDYKFKWNCFYGYQPYEKRSVFENKDKIMLMQSENSKFTITCTKQIDNPIFLEIFDLQGISLFNHNLGSNFNSKTISVDIKSGVYIIKIFDNNNTYWLQKIVIAK